MMNPHEDEVSLAYPKTPSLRKSTHEPWPLGIATAGEHAVQELVRDAGCTPAACRAIRHLVYRFDRSQRRSLPWRGAAVSPYQVLVSEIMLQQTQVDRVIPKYLAFIERFPTVAVLAQATLPDVVAHWQGLGYYRRGRYLRDAAVVVMERFQGELPSEVALLTTLPGVGEYTAAAVRAFAFNRPSIVIETNIRAVLLYLLHPGEQGVTDTVLRQELALLQPTRDYRRWYAALMDYGSDLKRRFANPSRASAHHVSQGRFEGSDRQIRGELVRQLLAGGPEGVRAEQLVSLAGGEEPRVQRMLDRLVGEGLAVRVNERYLIPKA